MSKDPSRDPETEIYPHLKAIAKIISETQYDVHLVVSHLIDIINEPLKKTKWRL